MGFCRLEDTFHDEPKWFRIGEVLGIDEVTAGGHVSFLYSWAARHAKDGDLRDFEPGDLERAMRWKGEPGKLVATLLLKRICILEKSKTGLFIHRYLERAETYKAAQKKRRQRAKDGDTEETSEEVVPGHDGDSPDFVPREREEREELTERASGIPARANPSGDMLFEHSVTASDARELIDHWQTQRVTRGEPQVLVVPPAWTTIAKKIIAAAPGLETAKQVVTAYVQDRSNPYWEKRKWALELLARDSGEDLSQARLLVGSAAQAPVDGDFIKRMLRETEAAERGTK